MARSFQTLQVGYWENAMKLSPDEKLVELFLMLNRNCECSGLQQIHPGTIAKYLGMNEKQIEKALKDLEDKGRIGRCEGDWIIIPGKWEHQQRKTGQAEIALQNSLNTAPRRLQLLFENYLENHSCLIGDNKESCSNLQDARTCLGSSIERVESNEKGVIPKPAEPSPYEPFVKEILPDSKFTDGQLEKQCRALEFLIRDYGEQEVLNVLRWGAHDETVRGSWQGWKRVFHSIERLRPNGNEKYLNMRSGYLTANEEDDYFRDADNI